MASIVTAGKQGVSKSGLSRVAYLDGLRGLAAVQVVILHYVIAFAPAIGNVDATTAHPAWQNIFIHSPLFFPADGYLAVAIFFLISGTVLTYSFQASGQSTASQVQRRVVRLGAPMAASVLLAAGLFWLLPQAHAKAGALVASSWLTMIAPQPGIVSISKEIFLSGLFLGHAHFSLVLPGMFGERLGLMPLSHSFNSPLWTLHLEFYGSLLVLLLVGLESRLKPAWHRAACAAALLLLIAHPLGLFVIGYITAHALKTGFWQKISRTAALQAAAILAFAIGVCMSAHTAPSAFMRVYDRLSGFEKLPMHTDDFHFYSQYGAILIFFAVLALPALQRMLSSPICRSLGRHSFSLYLVHFPILFTVTATLVVDFQPLGHITGILLASVCGLALTVLMTIAFERLIDGPATKLSRRLRWPIHPKPFILKINTSTSARIKSTLPRRPKST